MTVRIKKRKQKYHGKNTVMVQYLEQGTSAVLEGGFSGTSTVLVQ